MSTTYRRGEIVTILTIGALIVIGISTFVSSFFLSKNKQTTTSKAQALPCKVCSGNGICGTRDFPPSCDESANECNSDTDCPQPPDNPTPTIQAPYCGDDQCNGYETCITCQSDCGPCSTPQPTQPSSGSECADGQWRTECASPKTAEGCPSNAGVEHAWLCQNGKWIYQYPGCTVSCGPGGPPAGRPTCPGGKTASEVINSCVKKVCDTNVKQNVCIEQFCDNDGKISEKPGRTTGPCSSEELKTCKKGGLYDYCYKQVCDRDYYVCVDRYWGDDCQLKEKTGTKTATRCGKDKPEITGTPKIDWGPIATPVPAQQANCFCDAEKGTLYGPNCPRKYIGQNCDVTTMYRPEELCGCDQEKDQLYGPACPYIGQPCSKVFKPSAQPTCKESGYFKDDAGNCFQCTASQPPMKIDCQKLEHRSEDQIYSAILQNDCRCVNGKWQGGLCDSWQRGRACGLRENCLAGGARCGGWGDSSCCSGFCQQGPNEAICASDKDIIANFKSALTPTPAGGALLSSLCFPGGTRCYGDVIQQCKNFLWATVKTCAGGCAETDSGIDCKGAVAFIPEPTGVVAASQCARAGENAACNDEVGDAGVCVGTGFFNLGGLKCLRCNGSTVPVAGRGCVDLTQKIGGCSLDMGMRYEAGKCFSCVKAENNQWGEWIAINPGLCKEYEEAVARGERDKKFSGQEILNNAISPEDQYRIRQRGYDALKAKGDFGTNVAVTGMQIGDAIGGLFGNMGKGLQRGGATIGDTFGQTWFDRNAEAGSSLGGYYQQTLNTKIELEKQGKAYTVDIGQAALTGLAGGLKYADGLTMGITNTITGGGIDKINDAVLTAAYGNNEALKKAALSAQTAGSDLTNAVAMIVPAAKGVQLVGTGVEAGGARLAASGIKGGGALKAAGGAIKTVGRGAKYLSPEVWWASFIKSAPITTAMEVGVKALPARIAQIPIVGRPVMTAMTTAKTVLTAASQTGVGKVVTAPVRAGAWVIDWVIDNVLLPRSAVTYSADEAAALLARDVNLGLATDAKQAAARLAKNYHINLSDVSAVDKFTETIKNNRVGNFDITALGTELKSPIIRQTDIANRLSVIDQTAAGGAVDPTDVSKLNKKFSGINNPTKLAEAILFEKEAQLGRSIINDPAHAADIALAKAKAQAAMAERAASGFGLGERVVDAVAGRFGRGKIGDIKNQVLENLDAAADKTAIETKLKEFGYGAKNIDKVVNDLSEKLRIEKMSERIAAIKGADPAKVAVELATVDKNVAGQLGKKFGKINNPDELAERILHEWEKIDKTSHIGNPDKAAAAQAYAKTVLAERAAGSLPLGDRFAGLLGKGKQNVIEKDVLSVLKAEASPDEIKAALQNFGYPASKVNEAAKRVSENLRVEKMPERITALKNSLNDPNFSQMRQEVKDSINNNSFGAKDNLDRYAKQFKKIKDPDQLAEVILNDWEKAGGRSLVGDARELAAAQAYAGEIIAGRTKPLRFYEKPLDAVWQKLGKGTAQQEKQALNYLLANGLTPTDNMIRNTLERFGYRGNVGEAVNHVSQNVKDISRLKDLPNRLNIIKNPDPTLLASEVAVAKPHNVIADFKNKFKKIVDPDELAESILYQWEKLDPNVKISDPRKVAAAQAYAQEIMAQRAKQAFSPLDSALDLFGRGRKADIERQVMASLPATADKNVFKNALLAHGYDEKALVNVFDGLYDKFKTPAVNKQWSFFERVTGFPQKLENQAFDDLVARGVAANDTKAIMDVLKKEGYPLADLLGNRNLTGATQRIKKRLDSHYAGGGTPIQPAPVRPAATRPPKQEFNWLEKLSGKPQTIENQVRRQLGGARTLDEYKNALRAAGYVEREIDAAVQRIQASFPQAAPMAGVPQSVPIKQPPPAKPVKLPVVAPSNISKVIDEAAKLDNADRINYLLQQYDVLGLGEIAKKARVGNYVEAVNDVVDFIRRNERVINLEVKVMDGDFVARFIDDYTSRGVVNPNNHGVVRNAVQLEEIASELQKLGFNREAGIARQLANESKISNRALLLIDNISSQSEFYIELIHEFNAWISSACGRSIPSTLCFNGDWRNLIPNPFHRSLDGYMIR